MNAKLHPRLVQARSKLQAAVDVLETLDIADLRTLSNVIADLESHCRRLSADRQSEPEQTDGFSRNFRALRGRLADHDVFGDHETG